MYTEIILWHNQSRHNRGTLEKPTVVERGHNPNCGDDLMLSLEIKDDVVMDAKYTGAGCAISQASMSIMIDMIKGRPVEEAKHLADIFLKMATGKDLSASDMEALGDASIFEGLSKMPARVKCGTLGWHCLETALK